jgi:hypothetical protein
MSVLFVFAERLRVSAVFCAIARKRLPGRAFELASEAEDEVFITVSHLHPRVPYPPSGSLKDGRLAGKFHGHALCILHV